VEITDSNGCKATSDNYVFTPTEIRNKSNGIRLSVYPNPANESITMVLKLDSYKNTMLKITNTLGQIVYKEQLQGMEFLKTLSLSKFSAGAYQLSVSTDDSTIQSINFVKK
jgi:hypothetical protein